MLLCDDVRIEELTFIQTIGRMSKAQDATSTGKPKINIVSFFLMNIFVILFSHEAKFA